MSAQTAPFERSDLDIALKTIPKEGMEMDFDTGKEVEIQTDKTVMKLVPCGECRRPLAVNRFYAAMQARCASCKGLAERTGVGQVTAPTPGKTEPAQVKDLTSVLINPGFAFARCPAHPDDPEHEMELKTVHHSDHYGPSDYVGHKDGKPLYKQIAPGETAMHQCLKCKATVAYGTTAQTQFMRINEVREGKNANAWVATLGKRVEV